MSFTARETEKFCKQQCPLYDEQLAIYRETGKLNAMCPQIAKELVGYYVARDETDDVDASLELLDAFTPRAATCIAEHGYDPSKYELLSEVMKIPRHIINDRLGITDQLQP